MATDFPASIIMNHMILNSCFLFGYVVKTIHIWY